MKTDDEYKESRQFLVEFILDNNQAFSILNCKSFRQLLSSLDKNFTVPCDKTVKTMIGSAYEWSCTQLSELLMSDCIAASITTDFWTSRTKHGYIGITCSWISIDWKPKEALLELERVPYPHTGVVISQILKSVFEKWKIEKKVIALTTDNGSNIKKAARLLNTIDHLPCAAHTLQLTVGQGLNIIKVFVLRVKRLIDFFHVSPKQSERLNAAQQEIGYKKNLSVIGDVSTRWNSSFYAWKRLLILQRAIIFLPSRLKSDLNNDVRNDGEKLERIMLTNNEWELLSKLVDILEGFEEVTALLSGAKYTTISLIYPAISRVILEIKPRSEPSLSTITGNDEEEFVDDDDQVTILENIEEIIEYDKDTVEIIDGNNKCRKKVDISKPLTLSAGSYIKEIKKKCMKVWQNIGKHLLLLLW